MTKTDHSDAHFALGDLAAFLEAALLASGADADTAESATRAMMHATRFGVDSHGVRLLDHYITEMEHGRVTKTPSLAFSQTLPAIAALDAGHAQGARATFAAMEKAMEMAETCGIGAVGIGNSAHFGAAGAYAFAAAERGFFGYACCNADKIVKLHGGAAPFHSTNPHAWAMPMPDGRHWFLDMATSAIPLNRVKLYRSLGTELPEETAADAAGEPTTDANDAVMLMPLGGAFGFKGAGLAGVAEVLSAVMNAMNLSEDVLPMGGPDLSTPRKMGAFVMAMRVDAFASRASVDETMARYLEKLRSSAAQPGETVMAPGDREWAVADARERSGTTLDPDTADAFTRLAQRYGIAPLKPL
ncbi:Ldh family oxidoreductase [Acuticoccus sp. MNP-M23]|uniref:Ldh family oxidoreductase n=1 Tax=Acuticoccus sp. MNP-M23 TaxID=3072793 RepID=UPI002814A353|nr:Ldh family oxidoreductase [Acuticoccus sp. MNP-M23]WMS44099.1 Ldh family oxidoreductase [Acuticoccus sp. MNP-M23]